MKTYIGLGVSDKETSICVLSETGKIIWEGKCKTEPENIETTIRKKGLEIEAVCMETGMLTPWLVRELRLLNIPVICIYARSAKSVLQSRPIKTDKNDARTLAELLKSGFYREVYVKSESAHLIRMLLRSWEQLSRTRRKIMGTIRGLLKPFGLKLGKVSSGKFSERVRELIAEDAIYYQRAKPCWLY